jgi:hypothetical protein
MKQGTTVVCKVKAGKEKVVLGASKPLKIGHANDCAVRGSIIYVTHSGEKNVIHRVSTGKLQKLSDVMVTGCKGGFNGISCMGKGFILKKMGSRKCYVTDDLFRYKSTIVLSKTRKIGQGMTWHKGRLYRGSSIGQSKKNYVCVYNSKGKLLKTYHYDHKGELEDVFIVDDKIKVTIYTKPKKHGKRHFECHIKTIASI